MKVGGGASRGPNEYTYRWNGHVERGGGGVPRGSSKSRDKWIGQAKKVGGGALRGFNACTTRWRGRMDNRVGGEMRLRHTEQANVRRRRWRGWKASPIDHCATTTNRSSAGFIMVCDAQEFHPSTFMGAQEFKDLQQMDKACDNPVTQFKHQGDARFISKSGNMEAEGTMHREDFTTFLAGTNSPLNETWGIYVLYSSLHVKICLAVWVSLSGHPLSFVVQFFSLRVSFLLASPRIPRPALLLAYASPRL
jgi:hypothetical protein